MVKGVGDKSSTSLYFSDHSKSLCLKKTQTCLFPTSYQVKTQVIKTAFYQQCKACISVINFYKRAAVDYRKNPLQGQAIGDGQCPVL
jgi:hypothetical protein